METVFLDSQILNEQNNMSNLVDIQIRRPNVENIPIENNINTGPDTKNNYLSQTIRSKSVSLPLQPANTLTTILGYTIPIKTLYFIIILLIISGVLYFLTQPSKTNEPENKKTE